MAKEKAAVKEESVKEETPQKEEVKQEQPEQAGPSSGMSLYTWLILAAVVLAGSTGGFALSQLIGGPVKTDAEGQQEAVKAVDPIDEILAATQQGQTSWLFDELEPVLANLDEPGVSRFVRVLVTLEMSAELDQEKGRAFLTEKQVILKDWMTTYFAGLSLEDVRGSRNLGRIKEEVQNHFNEILFPNNRPFVLRVLFKEFAVQ